MLKSRLIKTLLASTIVLVFIALVLFYQQVPHHKAPYAKAIDSANEIFIQQGSSKVELDRQGKEWKVKNTNGELLASDNDRVEALLSSLKGMQVEDEITNRPDQTAEFEVTAESGTRITFASKNATLADGIFGKQAPDFNHIYFRFPDRPSIYLASGVIRGELAGPAVSNWRNHEVINIPDAQIQSIVIDGKDFKTDLERSSDTWTLGGAKIDPGPVYGLVGTLAHLSASDFVDPAIQPQITYDSLDFASVHVGSDHNAIDLRIGPEDVANHRYPAAVSKNGGIAWISENQVKTILRKPADFRPKK